MKSLEEMGNPGTKKIFIKHGAKEPIFGVKVGDLKIIQKKVKKNQELSLELYDTGNGDAMYLAGLIADEKQVTKEQLNDWAKKADWYSISEYTVPWLAADAGLGWDVGLDWIKSGKENIASSGWSALSNHVSLEKSPELDTGKIKELLEQVEKDIHSAQNRVRYTMNGFVLAVGCYVPELSEQAIAIAEKIGKVDVEMGGTACKVPFAPDYIRKVKDKGRIGKKRKKARC